MGVEEISKMDTELQELMQLRGWKVKAYCGKQPERMLQWAEHLESGKWTQLFGRLGRDGSNERCCLGVAVETRLIADGSFFEYGERGGLDDMTTEWLDPNFTTNGQDLCPIRTSSLKAVNCVGFVGLNDDCQVSFKHIAQIIRESVALGAKTVTVEENTDK